MLRIGFLGVAHFHASFWTRAFLAGEGVSVAGVWDSGATLAAAFAAKHGVPVLPDIGAVLAAADAIAICSATADHRPLIEAAAAAGKPVLCEKPLAPTLAEALKVRDAVTASGIRFMQSFPKRFDPVNHEVRALLAEGAVGRVTLCRVRHGHRLGEALQGTWFVDPALSGGGTLIDEGVHAADFLCFLFGPPESVFATASSAGLGLAVEDTALATYRYADGLLAEVATSWCFAAADTSIEIYGTEGTILLAGVDLASKATRDADYLRVFRRSTGAWTSSATVPYFRTGVFHEHVAFAFVEALKHGGPMPVTLDDGLRAAAMIDAAYRSVASGRTERIAFP